MEHAVSATVKSLSRALGDQLEAIFLFGSIVENQYKPGGSDHTLLIVIQDGASIHALRESFLPVWVKYSNVLGRAPLVAPRSAFDRYIRIHPILAHHLAFDAEQLLGAPDLLDGLPPTDPRDIYARLAAEAVQASAALTPGLLDPEVARQRLSQLRSLARRVRGNPIDDKMPVIEQFAMIQQFLEQKIASLTEQTPRANATTARLIIPGVLATYRQAGSIIMVLEKLSPSQILNIEWKQLEKRLSGRCSGLCVTSEKQFRLSSERERPLDHKLQRCQHEWGTDLVSNMVISRKMMLRHASRVPAEIQIDLLPKAYLTQEGEDLHGLIHDFQNKILNVQLEHELLYRLQNVPRYTPPEPLPDRSAPSRQRIDAIHKHLGYWSEYYYQLMLNSSDNS